MTDPRLAATSAHLTAALDEEIRIVADQATLAGPETFVLHEAAVRATSGGKRLRAMLCIAAARSLGVEAGAGSPAVRAGAALELFQAAALVHDDLMDDSDTRRGVPSSHRWFEAAIPMAGAPTDVAERFGSSAAILLGDLLLTMSSTALTRATADLPASRAAAATTIYASMAAEVALGQYLDLYAAHAPWDAEADLDRALRVIRSKSGRYSVELPLTMGATLAGADDETLAWFTAVGGHVGTAFQLRDDVLGVFGDPAVTGKPAGDDLVEGKRTVLVALAYRDGTDADRDTLRTHLGAGDLDAELLARLHEILERTGARDGVEQLIAQHTAAVEQLLGEAPAQVRETAELAALLRAAVTRQA